MTNRTTAAMAYLLIGHGLIGCSTPTAPTPGSVAPPSGTPSSALVMFRDPVSGVATSDLHDADEQIVRFTEAGELIWAADGSRFPGWTGRVVTAPANAGLFHIFKDELDLAVRFGPGGGERRAYLTFMGDSRHEPCVVDVEVVRGQLLTGDSDRCVLDD